MRQPAARLYATCLGLSFWLAGMAVAATPDPGLKAALDAPHRSSANKARDIYRHPVETLTFFGLTPAMTVVEVYPGNGWYTEILAPYLKERGKYYAAGWDPEAAQEFIRKGVAAYRAKLDANPDLYSAAEVTVLAPPGKTAIAPAGSADLVLTFRNVHNWMAAGTAEPVFKAMYAALKPGGYLGVVEHRAPADAPQDPKARKGYVREDHAIRLAEDAGFKLVARSEINANPRDTKDYPKGVWTLPPTYAEGDKDRDRYAAIGESDRFTLLFQKPGP